jgi:hypothetical protein
MSVTSRTMSTTRSNCGPSFTSRQAAPMHTRDTPFCFARWAISMTVSFFKSVCGVMSVSYRDD